MTAGRESARPSVVTRLWRALNRHPRAVGAVLLLAGLGELVAVLVDGHAERLTLPVVTILAGLVAAVREYPRVDGGAWVVPNRWAGGRRVPAAEIRCVEVVASVWSTAASVLVLDGGERVRLAGVDRLLATELAERLGVRVERVATTV